MNQSIDIKFDSRTVITTIIYFSLLFDNILLTVIVPILPDLISNMNGDDDKLSELPDIIYYKNLKMHTVSNVLTGITINVTDTNLITNKLNMTNSERPVGNILRDENANIGILLGIKAIVQLIINPIVGNLSTKMGYKKLIVFGTFSLLLASIGFLVGESYVALLLARATQGIGSACIGVCGMSLIAEMYPEEEKRSKVMGITLGSIALGVLAGYPFGGVLYDLVGRRTPFVILTCLIAINLGFQLYFMDLEQENVASLSISTDSMLTIWRIFVNNEAIFLICFSIFLSTSAMATLEPCLPIWLIRNLHPEKWQLGTVFIPDSFGYFIGANCFGSIAFKYGQIKVSIIAIVIVGVSCIMVPYATTVKGLLLPHFSLGLGIGTIDSALVPLLANLMDMYNEDIAEINSCSHYGSLYAIQQTAVCLAYSLGPILGGEAVEYIGFRPLMIFIGVVNILFAPILFVRLLNPRTKIQENGMPLTGTYKGLVASNHDCRDNYVRLYNSID